MFSTTRTIIDKKIIFRKHQELVKVKVKKFKVCCKITTYVDINFSLDQYGRAFKDL